MSITWITVEETFSLLPLFLYPSFIYLFKKQNKTKETESVSLGQHGGGELKRPPVSSQILWEMWPPSQSR